VKFEVTQSNKYVPIAEFFVVFTNGPGRMVNHKRIVIAFVPELDGCFYDFYGFPHIFARTARYAPPFPAVYFREHKIIG